VPESLDFTRLLGISNFALQRYKTLYYLTDKPTDFDWVALPAINFDAYFGTTSFSSK